MNKHISRLWIAILGIVVAATIGSGCTRNNGDIGDWFGIWKVKSISTVGDLGDEPALMWKFQSNILVMQECWASNHNVSDHFGTWTQVDDHLIVDFSYSDDNFPVGSWKYTPPAVTGIGNGQTTLLIKELSHRRIILVYDRHDGAPITYTLIKWG